MTGLIDVGGGMRDIYGAGVMDCFLDKGITFDVCIGVSAGSANIASFLAKQKGRNYRFYTQYASRKEYMGLHELVKNGSYINLDYVYSVLSNSDSEDPLDFDTIVASPAEFIIVATDGDTGDAQYFNKKALMRDDFWLFKASSAIPIVCKPYERDGRRYVDGGISDPIPVEKAFALGCDKVVVIIPRPPAEKGEEPIRLMKLFLKNYPAVLKKIEERPSIYNHQLQKLYEYVNDERVILISPDSDKGLNMVTRDSDKLDAYYKKGYHDALDKIEIIKRDR